MTDIFYGWRRKAGCITLVMALLFMSVWIRSTFKGDFSRREWGPVSYVFISAEGEMKGLSWNSSGGFRGNDISFGLSPGYLLRSHAATAVDLRTANVPFHEFRLQYWSIVIPLTMLSACLLLAKPRVAKPKIVHEN